MIFLLFNAYTALKGSAGMSPLRQAAIPLHASGRECGGTENRESVF